MKAPTNQTASESSAGSAGRTPPELPGEQLSPRVEVTTEAGVSHDSQQSVPDVSSSTTVAINATTSTQQTDLSTVTDLQSLRLPANYGASLGVKKLLTNVPVGKPGRGQFFRTHKAEDMTFDAMLLEQKESGEKYVVTPNVAQAISELVRPVRLHAAIDRQNNVFLIRVPLPDETGTRNPWHESLAQAVELAKSKWVRIDANRQVGAYDVSIAQSEKLPEPEWPAHDIDALVRVAFRGKIITDLDHPVVQSLLGRV